MCPVTAGSTSSSPAADRFRELLKKKKWNIYVGEERRVTVVRRVVANNAVFLVRALIEP